MPSLLTNDALELNVSHCNVINKKVVDVDIKYNRLYLDNSSHIKADYIVFAHGSTINTFNIKGIEEHCHYIHTTKYAQKLKSNLNNLPLNSHIVVIGCGPTGVETIGHLIDTKRFKLSAIDALPRPLTMYNKKASEYVHNTWKQFNVNSYFDTFVKNITDKEIETKNKSGIANKVQYDLAIWCGGFKISPLTYSIMKQIKLHTKNTTNSQCNKGIVINDKLEVENTNNIYAIGDCTNSGYPKTAQAGKLQI